MLFHDDDFIFYSYFSQSCCDGANQWMVGGGYICLFSVFIDMILGE